MITWRSALIDCAATRCNSSERSIHSERETRSTMASAPAMSSGAASIESTIAASSACKRGCDTSPAAPAIGSSTKPNSPPLASASATRSAVPPPCGGGGRDARRGPPAVAEEPREQRDERQLAADQRDEKPSHQRELRRH